MRFIGILLFVSVPTLARPPGVTSLTNKSVKYNVPTSHTVTVRRGPVEAVFVDNAAVGAHRAGYNGIASLTHKARPENVFVPDYAGLNFELIYDGSVEPREVLFEPRRAPMELRVINKHTVELYQEPTPNWKLESCTRFRVEKDGIIRMTFECIPRARMLRYEYIGLFWASYIHQPESGAIHFLGRKSGGGPVEWIETVSPRHGVDSTHPWENDHRKFERDAKFPSDFMAFSNATPYSEPFYYGVSHGMACVFLFRREDMVRITKSPSGGGQGNPAWDFQWMIPDFELDKAYGFEMQFAYVPFENPEQIRKLYGKSIR